MSFKLHLSVITGQFEEAFREKVKPMAQAATGAITQIADEIKAEARADIAGAGFSKKWQNALRVDIYPKRGVSLNAAALVYHKIPYADIFETGGGISGNPILWVPLSSTPKKIGTQRMSAKVFTKEVGPLQYYKRGGKKPLLMGQISVTKAQARTGSYGKITLARLRKGTGKTDTRTVVRRAVPLFVGVDSVNLRDRFSIREIIAKTTDKLAGAYLDKIAQQDIEG